jgi:hypothetical protein
MTTNWREEAEKFGKEFAPPCSDSLIRKAMERAAALQTAAILEGAVRGWVFKVNGDAMETPFFRGTIDEWNKRTGETVVPEITRPAALIFTDGENL